MDKQIVVTGQTLVALLLIVLGVWVTIQVFPVIFALFVSLLLTLMLTPIIDWAQERKIPRGMSTAILYLVILSFLGSVGVAGIKPITSQMNKLLDYLPIFIEEQLGVKEDPFQGQLQDFFSGQLNANSNNVISATLGIFSNFLFVLSIFVFTFYLLVEFDAVKKLFISLFPMSKKVLAENLVGSIENILGAYIRGQLLLGMIIGVLTYLGLVMLKVEYALSLALVAGVLEIVPVIGPILSAIPALIVALSSGPWTVLGVALLYTIIQQTENNILVPTVMKKTVGLNPLVTLILLLVGGALFGIIGVILAVPSALIAYLVFTELYGEMFGLKPRAKKANQVR